MMLGFCECFVNTDADATLLQFAKLCLLSFITCVCFRVIYGLYMNKNHQISHFTTLPNVVLGQDSLGSPGQDRRLMYYRKHPRL